MDHLDNSVNDMHFDTRYIILAVKSKAQGMRLKNIPRLRFV